MKRLLLFGVLATLLVACTGNRESDGQLPEVRVGWQTVWATQAQTVVALKTTRILEDNGVAAKFVGFASGPPAVEAAMAGSLDVVSGGSQPMLQLVTANKDWVLVSRHANVRLGILVPPDSDIAEVVELGGHRVGVPVGSTAERFVLLEARAAGLTENDLEVVNLRIQEQSDYVQAGSRRSWGDIAAVSAWEPTVSLLERSELGRVIQEENEVTLTAMSRRLVEDRPEVAAAYLRATLEAWAYYAKNRSTVDREYLAEVAVPVDLETLEAIARNEPNAWVADVKDVDIALTPAIRNRLQTTIDFLAERELIGKRVGVEDVLDDRPLRDARNLLQES